MQVKMNSLINSINHAGIIYTLIFNLKNAFDLPRDVCPCIAITLSKHYVDLNE